LSGNISAVCGKHNAPKNDEGKLTYKNITDDENITLIFSISDTGHGMTEMQIEKLFNDFTRFNIEENRTIVGTGLGMSITKYLVNLMNGEISVQSELGKGSVFTVRLPQKRTSAAVCGNLLIENLNSDNLKKQRFVRECMLYGSVLVVDDVESNLIVAKGLLLPYGINVETVNSGFKAIDKIKEGNVYDIILMDHMMPKMNGIETVKILREMGYKNSIIAFTANALIGQSEIYLQNGFDSFLSKPIDSRELNKLLNEYLKDKKQPEIVKAVNGEHNVNKDDVIRFFILDAEKAINILSNINLDTINDKEIELYIITIHGIKTALANIGENELSRFALKLEQAGREQNLTVILNETKIFTNTLQRLIEKLKIPAQSASEQDEESCEDMAYLNEKLKLVKEACLFFNKKGAKEALNDLKQKRWSAKITAVLDDITVLLLHGEFEKVTEIVTNPEI